MDVQRSLLLCGVVVPSLIAGVLSGPSASPETTSQSEWGDWLDEGYQYVENAQYRRDALEASLANPKNGYSRARLDNYTEDAWGALPVWTPRVKRISPSDIGGERPEPDFTWERIAPDVVYDDETLFDIGATYFLAYPAQIESAVMTALSDPEAPSRYGLWQTEEWVGGLLWVELPDGTAPALSCATCHASLNDRGALVPGLPNYDFDLGKLLEDHRRRHTPVGRWGPGRVDVTSDDLFNPTVIADLRPIRFQSHLQRAATVKNSLAALAVRIETSAIQMTRAVARPPREAVLGISLFLWSLGDAFGDVPSGPGRDIFDEHCADCHTPPTFSGDPTPIAQVGADDTVAKSPYRTTGCYQTPTLRGVGARRRLTAAGNIPTLDHLLSKKRTVTGHPFGQHLDARDRTHLIDFLSRL